MIDITKHVPKPERISDNDIADYILESAPGLFIETEDEVYRYKNHYVRDTNRELERCTISNIDNLVSHYNSEFASIPFIKDDNENKKEREVAAYKLNAITKYLNTSSFNSLITRLKIKIHEPDGVLDSNRKLIGNCFGTVIDFEMMKVRDSDTQDMISLELGASYHPIGIKNCTEEPEHLMHLLRREFSDEEIRYLQMAFGSALMRKPQKVFLNFIGLPNRGKTLLINLFAQAFGSYAISLPSDVFTTEAGQRGTRDDILLLRNKCLAYVDELITTGKLNSSLIKSLTGSTSMSVRGIYKKPIQFKFDGLIVNTANENPSIDVGDSGMDLRFVIVPFKFEVIEPQSFFDDLYSDQELRRVIHWLFQGAVMVKENGGKLPDVPPRFIAAKKEAIEDISPVDAYLSQYCIIDKSKTDDTSWRMPLFKFKERVRTYCELNGIDVKYIPNTKQLKNIVHKRGLILKEQAKYFDWGNSQTINAKSVIIGIREKSPSEHCGDEENDTEFSPDALVTAV